MSPTAAPPAPKDTAKTQQWRAWQGQNNTDARVAIADEELFWCENAITIGKGQIQIVPGPGASIATVAAGPRSLWGFVLVASPILISINADGSATQITVPGGVQTVVAAAATFVPPADLTIWQNTPVLIIDTVTGYYSWDGTTLVHLVALGAPATGISIAVFEGRVWIALPNSRTIVYSAPNSYTDFTAANGGGSFVITDDAFVGNITHLVSAVEQLWVFSNASVEAIANVQASGVSPSVVTTFSITNILDALGATAPHSVRSYFRALAFLSASGIYALSGVTPEKLSKKLDGLFEAVTLLNGTDAPAAIAVVRSQTVLCTLVQYTPSLDLSLPLPFSGLTTVAPLVLCFTEGKWFVATQGALIWITTVVVGGQQQAWGTNGSTITRLFGAPGTTAVSYKLISKFYDFGTSVNEKHALKVGLEIQAPAVVAPTFIVESERARETSPISLTNELIFVGTAPITFVGTSPIHWITTGMVLGQSRSAMWGHFLGFTISGTDIPYRIQAVQMEVVPSREWSTP